jgi:hypothetical protein
MSWASTRETLPDFSRGFVYTPPSELGWIAMGKPNSHQPLERWDVHTSRSRIEALPKHIIEEFIPDIHKCVGTPQISSRDH